LTEVSEITEVPSELRELQVRFLGETVVNLITKETPKEVIKTRPGRGGNYPYVPVYWFVSQLNGLFGYLWDIVTDGKGIVEEELELEEESKPEELTDAEFGKLKIKKTLEKNGKIYNIGDCRTVSKVTMKTQVWVTGHLNFKVPGKTIIEKDESGDVVGETYYDPIIITKYEFGGTDIKRYTTGDNAGMIIDLADDYKSAEADMLKKAASYLGMCIDVYGQRELLQETGPSEGQLVALYKRAKTKGLEHDPTVKLCGQLFDGLKPEGLSSGQYLKFMQHLLSRRTESEEVGCYSY